MSRLFRAVEKSRQGGTFAGKVRVELLEDARAPLAATGEGTFADRPTAEPAGGEVDPHLVSLLDPASFAAEQFRRLRYLVEQIHSEKGPTVLAITSPSVGDGKTMSAINLAGALAQNREARVLLVDCDLRKPSLSLRLGLGSPREGVADAVKRPRPPLEELMVKLETYNLSVLPTGSAPASPYELLTSRGFGELVEEARGAYDYVIVDTPPVLVAPDCQALEKTVDAFLLVVRARKTRSELLESALEELPSGRVVGVVYNDDERVHRRHSAYHGYGYGSASS